MAAYGRNPTRRPRVRALASVALTSILFTVTSAAADELTVDLGSGLPVTTAAAEVTALVTMQRTSTTATKTVATLENLSAGDLGVYRLQIADWPTELTDVRQQSASASVADVRTTARGLSAIISGPADVSHTVLFYGVGGTSTASATLVVPATKTGRDSAGLNVSLASTTSPIILGSDVPVQVILRYNRPEAQEQALVRLITLTGSLKFVRSADGKLVFDYIAPDSRAPKYELIRAVGSDGAPLASLAIPLWGTETFVRNTRPGTVVKLIVGPSSFGPVRATRQGVAEIPFIVAPGIERATIIESYPDGTTGRSLADLSVPKFKPYAINLQRAWLQLDDNTGLPFDIFIPGQMAARTTIGFKSIRLSGPDVIQADLRQVESGHFRGHLVPATSAAVGPSSVFLEYSLPPTQPGAESVRQRKFASVVSIIGGQPDKIQMDGVPEWIAVGSPSAAITAVVVDRRGNRVPGAVPMVLAGGQPARTSRAAPNRFEVAADVGFAANADFVLSATFGPPGAQVTGTERVRLLPGTPDRIVGPDQVIVIESGNRETAFSVQLIAENGARIANEYLVASATLGRIRGIRESSPGTYEITYVSPDRKTGPDNVQISAPAYQAVAGDVDIQVDPPSLEISADALVGYLNDPGTVVSSLTGRVRLRFASGKILNSNLAAAVAVGGYGFDLASRQSFESNPEAATAPGPVEFRTTASVRALPLDLGLIYQLPFDWPVNVFAKGSFRYTLLASRTTSDAPFLTDTRTEFQGVSGFETGGGVTWELGPGQLIGELGYAFARGSGGDAIQDRVGGLNLQVGYGYGF